MRTRVVHCVWTMAIAALLPGCGQLEADRSFAQWPHRDQASWQLTPDAAVHRGHTIATTMPARSVADLPDDAGAADYVRLALERNPAVISARHEVDRLMQRTDQATAWDDPMLQVAPVGEMAQTAAGEVGLMTTLSQKLPFPGKLATRGRLAEQEVAMAAAELAQTRLDVAAEVRQAYWSYYLAQRAIEVTRQSRELLFQLRQIADTRFRTGTATQQDVLRASVELSNVDNELITLQQRLTTAQAMLNSLLDRPVTAPLPAPRPVTLKTVDLELDGLLAAAARHSPRIRRSVERIEAERQRLKLAKLQRWPDVNVALTYNVVEDGGLSMAANGEDQWWLGFGINLPIWSGKLRAAEREALSGIQAALADLTAVRNRIAFRTQDALARVQTQQRLVTLFHDVIVPQARQTVEASEASYRSGRVDFLTLVDNWRRLLDFELMYHQSLADLEKASAELQQVVGEDMPELTGPAADAAQPRRQSTQEEKWD